MIAGAIATILNVTAITDLVNDISPILSPQGIQLPCIVINESASPELYKKGYSVLHHELQVDIYAAKGKDSNGGFLQADTIATEVKRLLTYYSGTVASHTIETIILQNEQPLLDNVSQEARIILEFKVRENITEIT